MKVKLKKMISLRKVKSDDKDFIVSNAFNIIVRFKDVLEEEKDAINDYIYSNFDKNFDSYQIIEEDGKKIGYVCYYNYEDGVLLDEIYIIDDYRNKGIGGNIIEKLVKESNVYLWVYKDNVKAISLYEKLGFKELDSTETRLFMKYSKM